MPQHWAHARGFELTERSLPFVGAYLRNGGALRVVCGGGAYVLAAGTTAATGIDLGVSGWVWMVLGYLVGTLWGELTLARVPAGPTRVASLTPRSPGAYLDRWVRIGQLLRRRSPWSWA